MLAPVWGHAGAGGVVAVPVEAEVLKLHQLEDALGLPVDGAGLPLAEHIIREFIAYKLKAS
jgi:hypothetical protein